MIKDARWNRPVLVRKHTPAVKNTTSGREWHSSSKVRWMDQTEQQAQRPHPVQTASLALDPSRNLPNTDTKIKTQNIELMIHSFKLKFYWQSKIGKMSAKQKSQSSPIKNTQVTTLQVNSFTKLLSSNLFTTTSPKFHLNTKTTH